MDNIHKTDTRLFFFVFLILYLGIAVFARWNIIQAPITQERYNIYVVPHLKSSTLEILLSEHHRQIQIYKNAVSNILYKKFGVNEITFRAFSTIASLLTLLFIFLFTQKTIGPTEALIATLLFGVSYYSFLTIKNPYYGSFNMFGSFISFFYLFKGLETNKQIYWWMFGVFSFLNITNVLLAGITLPIFFAVATLFFFRKWKLEELALPEIKRRIMFFITFFTVSTLAALWLYHLRGLNLLGAVWDIATTHEVNPKVNADNLVMEETFYSGLARLFYSVFVTFNFEHGDGSYAILGTPEGPWVYFFLFLAGMWRLYKSHRELFWNFMTIFLVPIFISGVILRISEARFLALIHPFYLIAVALGFTYCFQWLKKFFLSKSMQEGVILFFAFLLFTWGTHPKPLWASPVYDELFETKGIREFRDYLKTHLKEEDVIINVTSTTELRTEVGDALNLFSFSFYLEEFREKHRMELLPLKTGKVGIWLILGKPLGSDKLVPFYFPETYSPKLIIKVKNLCLYYGEINIPKITKVDEDIPFKTPFWSYMKGFILHTKNRLKEAKPYYELAAKYGYNLERIYYNLALVNNINHPDISFDYMEKAIKIIETPTAPSTNNKIKSWETYGHNEKGLPDLSKQIPKLRHIYAEKNGAKYKKWFMEDLIKARPNYFALFYLNTMLYARLLYLHTGNEIFLNEVNQLYKRGSKLAKGSLSDVMREVANDPKGTFYSLPYLNLSGITEMYPPIKRS